jgi:hypothetical protein
MRRDIDVETASAIVRLCQRVDTLDSPYVRKSRISASNCARGWCRAADTPSCSMKARAKTSASSQKPWRACLSKSIHSDVNRRTCVTPYRVSKGTLRFPLSEPVPVVLIERIAKFKPRTRHGGRTRNWRGGGRSPARGADYEYIPSVGPRASLAIWRMAPRW